MLLLLALPAQAGVQIQHWQTSSGARVYFAENHDLPILDLSVDFPAGSSADTPEQSGLASLVEHLLGQGAEGLTEEQISNAFADVGASFTGRFDTDRAGLSLRTLSSAREKKQALDTFSRVLLKPTFPEAVVEREKARTIAAIKESDTKPETIADRAFERLLYGSHPYALRSSGEVGTVGALKRQHLVDFYQARYSRRDAVVAIMGDVTRPEAEAIAESLTAGLPEGKPVPALPKVALPERAETERIAHPATQAHILVGYPGINRGDPDYFPLWVGNYILGGGGFVSRLTHEVREKRGYAYSVYSYFAPLKQPGPFQIGLQTKKEQAEEALAVVRTTLDEFIARGVTEKELKAAKDNIIGGFPLRIDSNKKIHEYLAVIGFYGLPLTYLDDFTSNVDKVTAAQIQDAFKRRIDPQRMVTVVVGAGNGK
ncbi:MAG TPA: pitrilysin family protein [Burkholderiales bacterium]|nr:pitrilysin family protein [Burkholderiales bacterium]